MTWPPSVVTLAQSSMGGLLSQLALALQLEPPVAWYRATSTCRFTFTIPPVEGAATGPANLRALSRRGERETERILAVDDDPQTLRYLRDALASAGYQPLVTADPKEALRLVEAHRPRLVLLDWMLPEMDGIELMQDIFNVADVPVIFLPVGGQDQVIARAFEMGAVDYMVKPFSPTEPVAWVGAGRADGALLAGGPDHRLPRTPGVRSRNPGPTDRHRIPAAVRTFGQHRGGADLRGAAAGCLGSGALRRLPLGAGRGPATAAEAGRRCRPPQVHLHRDAGGLPDVAGPPLTIPPCR